MREPKELSEPDKCRKEGEADDGQAGVYIAESDETGEEGSYVS